MGLWKNALHAASQRIPLACCRLATCNLFVTSGGGEWSK